jgi:hypothetical protein
MHVKMVQLIIVMMGTLLMKTDAVQLDQSKSGGLELAQ